jgi:hypothetical protein
MRDIITALIMMSPVIFIFGYLMYGIIKDINDYGDIGKEDEDDN